MTSTVFCGVILLASVFNILPVDAKNFLPPGPFDISPAELDKLCQTIDSSFVPSAPTDPCIYMKWIDCPPGEGSGKPNEPCGWYQQTPCPDEPMSNNLRRRRQFQQQKFKSRQPSFIGINWPKKRKRSY